LITFSDLIVFFNTTMLADKLARSRLPAIYAFREAPDAGGLISYGPNPTGRETRGSSYRAADENRTRHQSQDGQSAQRQHPPSLLLRADQVIE